MSVWDAIWTGLVGGLCASLVWFLVFRLIRPRVRIAPKASWDPKAGLVRFKILNSASRDLIDLRFQLDVLRPRVGPRGITYTRFRVPLTAQPPVLLAGKRRGGDDSNAYRVAARLDPSEVFTEEDNHFVRFKVFGRDAVSGVGRVAEASYHSIDDFVTGTYEKGQTFEIAQRKLSSQRS